MEIPLTIPIEDKMEKNKIKNKNTVVTFRVIQAVCFGLFALGVSTMIIEDINMNQLDRIEAKIGIVNFMLLYLVVVISIIMFIYLRK